MVPRLPSLDSLEFEFELQKLSVALRFENGPVSGPEEIKSYLLPSPNNQRVEPVFTYELKKTGFFDCVSKPKKSHLKLVPELRLGIFHVNESPSCPPAPPPKTIVFLIKIIASSNKRVSVFLSLPSFPSLVSVHP